MKDKIERLREKLHISIEKYGLSSEKTKVISEEFNELINIYYKNEVQFPEDSIMDKKYKKSIDLLKRITSDFAKFPTIDEWNKYAKEQCLLCSESIKYITGLNWHELRNRIK